MRHGRFLSENVILCWIFVECAVLYSQDKDPVIVSDVKFLLPLTDLFVAFVAHFLADQNLVNCV